MRNTIIAIVIAAGIGFAAAPIQPANAESTRTWHACKAEDGSGQRRCVWDAKHMGNGAGHSLVIRKGGTDDATYRVVTHRRAHRLLAGELS